MWGFEDKGCPVTFADQLGRDTRARRVLKFNVGHCFHCKSPKKSLRLWKSTGVARTPNQVASANRKEIMKMQTIELTEQSIAAAAASIPENNVIRDA